MPCYSCCSDFGFLRNEVGCNICGFGFCTKCCKKREVQLKGELVKKLVCNKCFNKLSGIEFKNTEASPPLAHKKRMASLRSVSVDTGSNMPSGWSNEKDRKIAERLQRLKKDRIKPDLPSENDIAERLARLKGIEPSKYKAPPIEVYRPPDMRTAVEQASDLMKQVTLEAELDSRLVKPEDEIAARLARLRDEIPKEKETSSEKEFLSKMETETPENIDVDQASNFKSLQWLKEKDALSDSAFKDMLNLIDDPEYKKLMMDSQKEKDDKKSKPSEEEDDEEEANRLVEKFLATTDMNVDELESLDDIEDSSSKSEKDATEEFPWCVICTEDAKIRCFECDSDIYCLRCFKECHDFLDIKDHKTCPYFPQKNTAV